MNELSLFTGAGGGIWGSKLLGWTTVGYVEIDAYCQKVIRQRIRDGYFDDAPIFSDVRTFDGRPYRGRVDIVTAGVPCQWVSCVGKRLDSSTEKNLWPPTFRVIGEVRPSICFFENPPSLLTHDYFGTILESLEALGYEVLTPVIVSSEDCGADHERRRVWFAAYSDREPWRIESWNDGEEKPLADAQGVGEREPTKKTEPFTACGQAWAQFGCRSWRGLESELGRVADGVANRSDRLRAIGNAQSPTVFVRAWEELTGCKPKRNV